MNGKSSWLISSYPKLMRTLITLLVFTMTTSTGKSERPPDALVEKLTAAIRRHVPEAQVEATDKAFTAKHGTMAFTIHDRSKTGEVYAATRQEEGPNFRGFMLTVSREPGEYRGAAVTPQTLQGPYFPTYIDSPAIEDGKGHYWIRFSFGSRLDPKLQQAIFEALPKSRFPKQR
jgi:hypothetical protein